MAGPVVHLVERLICNEEVSGSSPLGSTAIKMTGFCQSFLLLVG